MGETKALLFAGDLFIAFKDPATGLFSARQQLECDKLAIGTPSDIKEKISKGRDTYGQAFVSFGVPKPTEFELTLSELTREIFAMQLSGILETLTAASGTLTDVPVTVVLDQWVEIGHENLADTGITVKNTAGTVTYDEGVDYELNRRLGFLKALSTGEIVAGDVHVSGAKNAITGQQILGASNYNSTFKFDLDGINLVTRKDMILRVGQATVSSQNAYDFMGGELANVPLKGRLEIPAPGQPPFLLQYRD
jgi:hypothetical protein